MTADHIIAFADALRKTARASGRDLNAANLFVHTVLARAIKHEDLALMAQAPPLDRPAPPPAQTSL